MGIAKISNIQKNLCWNLNILSLTIMQYIKYNCCIITQLGNVCIKTKFPIYIIQVGHSEKLTIYIYYISGGAATYCRLKPSIKVRYDYGVMIFILTFSLVAVSGMRDEVIEIARERLLMIVLGFVICLFTSLFIFPIWASDELHDSTISKFDALATSIQGKLITCMHANLKSCCLLGFTLSYPHSLITTIYNYFQGF